MERKTLKTDIWVCGGIIALMVTSCLIDLCIKAKLFDALLLVAADFQSAVFSGVLTFSTLSLTVISMIIGMMDANLGGIKLRELLKFKSAPIRFSRYMTMSALLCVAAIPALAFGLCTLMTVIALSALVYTTYAGILVFSLVSDPAAVRKLILQERKTEKEKNWEMYVGRWLKCYKEALKNTELEEVAHLSGLLAGLIEEEEKRNLEKTPVRDAVSRQLLMLLDVAAESMSFYEALEWSFDKLNLSKEKQAVCTEYLRKIRFLDAQQLLKLDLPGKLENLLADRFVDTDYAHKAICYEMIRCLNLNTSAGTVRDDTRNECIRIILSFLEDQESEPKPGYNFEKLWSKKCGNDKKKDVLLMVFYNEIVLASEQYGEALYRELLQGLEIPVLMKRRPSLEIVAEMFYGWCQDAKIGEKWNEERVTRSKKMVSNTFVSRNVGKINLGGMVSSNEIAILEYYSSQSLMSNISYVAGVRVRKDNEDVLRIKSDWGIRFAYRFYLAAGIPDMCSYLDEHPEIHKFAEYAQYKGYRFPLLARLTKGEQTAKLENDCKVLLKDFDPQTGEITAECMKDVLRIGEILDSKTTMEKTIKSYSSISMVPVYQAITDYLRNCETGEVRK